MGGFGISGQSISGGTKKKKYVDPRANATKAVYERHLADQARRNKVASSTVPSDPALRGGPSPVIASALQSVADRALLGQAARPVTTGLGNRADQAMLNSSRRIATTGTGVSPAAGVSPADRALINSATRATKTGLGNRADQAMLNSAIASKPTWSPPSGIQAADLVGGAAGAAMFEQAVRDQADPADVKFFPGVDGAPSTYDMGAGAPPALGYDPTPEDPVDAYLRDLAAMTEKERIDLAETLGAFDSEQDYLDALAGKGTWVEGNYIPAPADVGTPPPAGSPPPPSGTPPPPPGGTPPPVGGDMGVVGGGRPLDRQIGIIEEALSEREAAIKAMVDAGVIDIQAAQDLYDTERERVYEDFIAEQAGVMAGFESDMAAAQAERTADRNALNAQLIAAGIDPALVADEFAMMDATYQGGRDAERDYLDALGRIGTSADEDRALLGEAVFGGFGQDLRSTAREMDLNAAMLAAQDRQTARERGLSSDALAEFTGVSPGALFAGQYANIDTPGIREGRLQRAESARQFDEALLQREAESALDRAQLIRDKAVDDERFRMQMMSQGIDPDTGLSLFDPDDPMKFLTPAQRFEAMKAEELPLTTYFPMAIAQAQQQGILDENDITALSSLIKMNPPSNDAELSALLVQAGIPELMDVLLDMRKGLFSEELANLEEIATLAGTDDDDYEPFFMEGSPAEYIRREGWSGLNPLGWDWGEMGGVQKLEELGKWAIPGLFRD
jgi:hypothetical protein